VGFNLGQITSNSNFKGYLHTFSSPQESTKVKRTRIYITVDD